MMCFLLDLQETIDNSRIWSDFSRNILGTLRQICNFLTDFDQTMLEIRLIHIIRNKSHSPGLGSRNRFNFHNSISHFFAWSNSVIVPDFHLCNCKSKEFDLWDQLSLGLTPVQGDIWWSSVYFSKLLRLEALNQSHRKWFRLRASEISIYQEFLLPLEASLSKLSRSLRLQCKAFLFIASSPYFIYLWIKFRNLENLKNSKFWEFLMIENG